MSDRYDDAVRAALEHGRNRPLPADAPRRHGGFLDAEPTGPWAQAIDHLRLAHELMKRMVLRDPVLRAQSLGDVFEHQIEMEIGSITNHYRQAYYETATKPTRVIMRDDGTIEPL